MKASAHTRRTHTARQGTAGSGLCVTCALRRPRFQGTDGKCPRWRQCPGSVRAPGVHRRETPCAPVYLRVPDMRRLRQRSNALLYSRRMRAPDFSNLSDISRRMIAICKRLTQGT